MPDLTVPTADSSAAECLAFISRVRSEITRRRAHALLAAGDPDVHQIGARSAARHQAAAFDIVLELLNDPPDGSLHAGDLESAGHVQRSDCPCGPRLTHFEGEYVEACDIWIHMPMARTDTQESAES